MVFNFTAGMVILFTGCAAIVFSLSGYFLIRRKSIILYLIALLVSAVATLVVKILFTINILEYTSSYQLEKKLAIGFSLYKATDMQEIQLKKGGKFIFINASNKDMLIVPVVYGKSWNKEYIDIINSHTHFFYDKDIDYKPGQVPPKELYLNNSSSSVTKYWLTTKEEYLQEFPEGAEGFEDY